MKKTITVNEDDYLTIRVALMMLRDSYETSRKLSAEIGKEENVREYEGKIKNMDRILEHIGRPKWKY